jgi:hypothetical protein
MSELAPLTIVATGEMYGVVLSNEGSEYKIRLVETIMLDGGHQEFSAYGTGLFNRDQIVRVGFCENDYTPGLILAAAANYSHSYGNRSVRVID